MLFDALFDQFLGMSAFRGILSNFTQKCAWMLEVILEDAVEHLDTGHFRRISYEEMYHMFMPHGALTKRFGEGLIDFFNWSLRKPTKKLITKWKKWRRKKVDEEMLSKENIEELVGHLLETQYGKVIYRCAPLSPYYHLSAAEWKSGFCMRAKTDKGKTDDGSHVCHPQTSSLISGDYLPSNEKATEEHVIAPNVTELLSPKGGEKYVQVYVVEGVKGRKGLSGKAEYSVDYILKDNPNHPGTKTLPHQRGVLYAGLMVTDARGASSAHHPPARELYHAQVTVYHYTGPLPRHLKPQEGAGREEGAHSSLSATHIAPTSSRVLVVAAFRHKRLIIGEMQSRLKEIKKEMKEMER